jgi:hypothetical protein
MNIITQNPFRVLGLTGNATEKELQKQIGIIKRYAEVGKSKSFDYDFEFIGDFTRSAEEIQEASNRIEQAHKKFLYSLFWFVKNTQFDEIAFNNLKEKEIEKAIEIWNKTLKEEITTKNYSSYLNLSTLYIALSTIEEQIDLQKLQTGISLKGNLIHSESLKDLSRLVTGNGVANNPIDISKKFVDEIIELLKPYLNKNNGISTNDLISLFSTFPSSIQKYISSKFTEVPISAIENKIEKTTRKRKNNPQDAEEYGEELYKSTKQDLSLLKRLMGSSNVQFQMITNKLANEIMQCAIEYYNFHRKDDSNIDPGDKALKIAKLAKSIGPNGQVLDRIIENTEPIQEWVDEKPSREKQKVAESEISFVTKQLINFQNQSDTINNAKQLVINCKTELESIKTKLGEHDNVYLELSTAVAANAQGMTVGVVNLAMEKRNKYVEYINYQNDPFARLNRPSFRTTGNSLLDSFGNEPPYAPEYSLTQLKSVIKEAWGVTKLIGTLDMLQNQRNNYNKNKTSLKSIMEQLDIPTNVGQHIQKATGGCYIATMAYGDYDHPQVKILRKFRDERLATSLLGRSFISFYYATSPHLVELLKNQEYINKLIRNLLDRFINKLK